MAQTLALIKPWIDYVPQRQRRLGLFVLIALLVHFATFFFIRIDTTRAEEGHQPRIRVSIETPSAPAPALAEMPSTSQFWDQLTDPRLFILSQPPGISGGTSLNFAAINPSLSSAGPPQAAPPADFEFVHPVIPPLEQRVAETMIPPRQPFNYDVPQAAIAPATTWQWDDVLAKRQPTGVATLPSTVSNTEVSPTQLRIAVSPDGTVQSVLVDLLEPPPELAVRRADLDQLAVDAARKVRFQPTNQPGLVWGQVTIFWHYSAPPKEIIVPTPPTTGP